MLLKKKKSSASRIAGIKSCYACVPAFTFFNGVAIGMWAGACVAGFEGSVHDDAKAIPLVYFMVLD